MACELLSREIPCADGGVALVSCRQLAVTKALDLHIELIGLMGNTAFPFIEGVYNYADIIQTMRAGPELVKFMKRVCCEVAFEGESITPAMFDLKFGRDIMLVYKVFAFVVEHNFKDFFEEGLALNESRRLEAEARLKAEELKNTSPDQTSV